MKTCRDCAAPVDTHTKGAVTVELLDGQIVLLSEYLILRKGDRPSTLSPNKE